jgi:hypothetical protein
VYKNIKHKVGKRVSGLINYASGSKTGLNTSKIIGGVNSTIIEEELDSEEGEKLDGTCQDIEE